MKLKNGFVRTSNLVFSLLKHHLQTCTKLVIDVRFTCLLQRIKVNKTFDMLRQECVEVIFDSLRLRHKLAKEAIVGSGELIHAAK